MVRTRSVSVVEDALPPRASSEDAAAAESLPSGAADAGVTESLLLGKSLKLVEALERTVRTYVDENERLRAQVEKLSVEYRDLLDRVRDTETGAPSANAELRALRRDHDAQNQELVRLRQEVAERDRRLVEQHDYFVNSRSWRYTRFLRALKKAIKP